MCQTFCLLQTLQALHAQPSIYLLHRRRLLPPLRTASRLRHRGRLPHSLCRLYRTSSHCLRVVQFPGLEHNARLNIRVSRHEVGSPKRRGVVIFALVALTHVGHHSECFEGKWDAAWNSGRQKRSLVRDRDPVESARHRRGRGRLHYQVCASSLLPFVRRNSRRGKEDTTNISCKLLEI